MKRRALLLMAILLAAAGMRLFLAWRAHVPTLDTAVVGQMAVDILDGDRPLYFAGQRYMGALEAYVLAGIFAFVPPGRVTMTLATILFALAWIATIYVFFRKTFGDRAAIAAALLSAFPGWTPIWYTTAPYGGYPETYLFGMLLLIPGVRFLDREKFRPSLAHALGLAAVAALGVWVNMQVLPYLAAAALAGLVAWRRAGFRLKGWLAYSLIPLAIAGAALPQLMAEPLPGQPPLLDGYSIAAIARSWRGLWARDLQQCLLWTFEPAWIHIAAAGLMGLVLAGALVLQRAAKKQVEPEKNGSLMVGLMLTVFAVTYFPHPMSGFVPRYLVAPLTLLASWCAAVWVSQPTPVVRRTGALAVALLCAYNFAGVIHSSGAKREKDFGTLQEFEATIATAREMDLEAVMHLGSETEGYDGARLTFLAGGDPVFASAYSDRFLRHQLAWESSGARGFVVRLRHLPFVLGSLQAMGLEPGRIERTTPYALLQDPEVRRVRERVVQPEPIEGFEKDAAAHPWFDNFCGNGWPDKSAALPVIMRCSFREPVQLNGLRIAAADPSNLPNQYEIKARWPDGSWRILQACKQRIAGSYLSAGQVYFRGHHPWMDIRFAPATVSELEITLHTGAGQENRPYVDQVELLESTGEAWPATDAYAAQILQTIAGKPDARVVCERGLAGALRRIALQSTNSTALAERIPAPYNPRFPETQPELFPLAAGDYLLIIEEAYRDASLKMLSRDGVEATIVQTAGPWLIMQVRVNDTASGRVIWRGYRLFFAASVP